MVAEHYACGVHMLQLPAMTLDAHITRQHDMGYSLKNAKETSCFFHPPYVLCGSWISRCICIYINMYLSMRLQTICKHNINLTVGYNNKTIFVPWFSCDICTTISHMLLDVFNVHMCFFFNVVTPCKQIHVYIIYLPIANR